jgi:hypothetical protein
MEGIQVIKILIKVQIIKLNLTKEIKKEKN